MCIERRVFLTPFAWILILLELVLCGWLLRVIWKTESEMPTETIVPKSDEDVELVG